VHGRNFFSYDEGSGMDDSNAPATKGDLQGSFEQLRSEMRARHDDLKEAIRHFEARLLQAFYSYTQTTDVKLKDGEQADIAIRQRLTAVESRILEVEKRLNMPPAA
jgi:hypothetical protein